MQQFRSGAYDRVRGAEVRTLRDWKWLWLGLLAALMVVGTGCEKLKSRDEMNKGVQAYRANHYGEAVNHFKNAVEYDPTNQNAQLYLATSYMIQWIPGAESPDNKKSYDMARKTFQEVLKKDPKNSLALASMASMAYNSASSGNPDLKVAALEEAKKWNQRRIEVNPNDAEAYYYLGVIDWAEAFPPLQTARVQERMKPDDPGPIKDPKMREQLKAKYGNLIEEGINNLKKCLSIDKENEDAMSYLNLLLRKKADLEDSPEASKADIAQAEDWSNKSLDMRRIKATRPTAPGKKKKGEEAG
jgi:tetratricopeptide (TPR) repeat protein